MVRDPVCGMDVDEQTTPYRYHLDGGDVFYFCSEACLKRFKGEPNARKGWWRRLVDRIAQANRAAFGGREPTCHG